MNRTSLIAAALLTIGLAGAAHATPTPLPGANSPGGAYFVCSAGKDAFVIQYSDPGQDQATITTNTKMQYTLHRTPVSEGAMFKGKAVAFWTNGKRVELTGTHQPYTNCKQD